MTCRKDNSLCRTMYILRLIGYIKRKTLILSLILILNFLLLFMVFSLPHIPQYPLDIYFAVFKQKIVSLAISYKNRT